jgi:hypothetical protein
VGQLLTGSGFAADFEADEAIGRLVEFTNTVMSSANRRTA